MNRNIFKVIIGILLTVCLLCVFNACDDDDDDNVSDNLVPVEQLASPDTGNACADTDITYTAMDPYFEPREAEIREQIYNREDEFNKLDIDSDGFLSITEYNGTTQLFRDIDTNGDAKLSIEEARYMMTFAEIPSGSFIMGTDDPIMAFSQPAMDAGPAREVTIDGFRMAATEVTTAQYCLYLNSALEAGEITVNLCDAAAETRVNISVPAYVVKGAPGTELAGKPYILLSPITGLSHVTPENSPLPIPEHPLNQSWIRYLPDLKHFYVETGFEDWPAVFVKWYGAMAFAEYYGLSLPTEAEWEYAASGGRQYKFPTSDGTNGGQKSNYACYNVMQQPYFQGADTPEEVVGFRMTVGTYPSNPYGVFDLAGNVWEWALDWYRKDFYQYCEDNGITSNPFNPAGEEPPMDGSVTGGPGQEFSHDARICRGGSYNYHEAVTRTEHRFPVYPFLGNDHFGIRVVLRPPTTVFNGTE